MNTSTKAKMAIIAILCSISAIGQNNPLWLRYPSISPNGETIVFNYKGDIYKVAATGGAAIPLTLSDSYEFNSVWSNDGKHIAFASDRYGNFDVFVMDASGGDAMRLTHHSSNEVPSCFTVDNKAVVFEGLRQDAHTNVQFPSGVLAELYSVPVSGGRIQQILTTPAHNAKFSADGKSLIYHDRKGYENKWRKHHTSAVTRDIWVYNTQLKQHKKLSGFNGEDRNPVFDSNNDNYYYLSEKSGSFNVHKASLTNSTDEQITQFTKHPVRFLSVSDNNTLCFSFDGEIYTQKPGEQAQKISILINYDGRTNIAKNVSVNSEFKEISISSNGKEFAYVFRGEIFVSSIEHGTTKRITNTPWQERSVSFSPDGRSLLYAAEVNNSWNIYTQSIVRDEEPYFFVSTLLKQKNIIATDAEEFQPAYSPDGKEVAYFEDRTTLKVVNLETKKSRLILDGKHNYSYADGDMWFDWSPDSKWLLINFGQPEDVMSGEIGLIEASGNGTLRNLTKSGYWDFYPNWSSDGKMLTYGSTRNGTKGENGFPRNYDIYAIFLTQDAFDKYMLSKEDAELLKEKEDKEKEEDKDDDKKEKKSDSDEDEKIENLKIDWNNIEDRKVKLTVHTSDMNDWVLAKDCDKLYYTTRFEDKDNIWVTDLRTKETKLFAKINGKRTSMQLSDDGKFLMVLSDGKPIKVDTKDAKISNIATKGEMILKTNEERAYIFEHSWRQVREKFYVEDLQGVDWEFYYTEYKKFLPYINNNYDFTEMLSEMLGELNASHTGSGYRMGSNNGDKTASLGIFIDYTYNGNGIKVAEIMNGGPLNKASSKIKAGNIIEKIDGITLSDSIDWYQTLNRKEGKNVLLSVYNPESKKKWDEVAKPISLRQEYELLYKRWVKSREKEVEKLSNGKLGYVHVRGMNDASMRTVYENTLGKYLAADALVVDTRFNGGGNLHDVLSDFLNGKKYMEIIPHGQYVGHQPYNKWVKPSIVVMGESNYSDAHLFPVAYKIKEIGQTLGMPVPGTGTFVWWETQIDPSIYFGIPMGGWKPLGEPFLENNQLEPDIKVENELEKVSQGSDQQLEEAVKVLLETK